MSGYYQERLAGERLRRCYELASPRVQRCLTAEIDFVVGHLSASDRVLDLGCGYGREIPPLAAACGLVVGIDTSLESLTLARHELGDLPNCLLVHMDAADLGFVDASFDTVVCVQNGISAFHIELTVLLREALRVVRPCGTVLLSTYSDRFWPHRVEWFERQAEAGLLGPIDRERTGEGTIVCRDGFTATTVSEPALRQALVEVDPSGRVSLEVEEVDASSVFHVLRTEL